MGFAEGENMTASAPEEGRKCWLKVAYEGKSRMVEWHTALGTFKDMDSKVRKMFGLNDKIKLVYTYSFGSEIVMSSDEELATALQLMHGAFLDVTLSAIKKQHKGPLCRLARAANAQRPNVTRFFATLPASAAACGATISERLRACCASHCARREENANANENSNSNSNANPNANPQPVRACRMRRKIFFVLFFVFAAMMMARCGHHARDGPHYPPRFVNHGSFTPFQFHHEYHEHHQHHHNHHGHHNRHNQHGHNAQFPQYPPQPQHNSLTGTVTILTATYGGRDVTKQAQDFYARHNSLMPSNHVFGDPAMGQMKHLHVVFQHTASNGVTEVFSQSFTESDSQVALAEGKFTCDYPADAIVEGKSIRILGALYGDSIVTCQARRLASTGKFTKRGSGIVSPQFFGKSPSHQVHNSFTMAYIKDNVVHTLTAHDGQAIVF